MEKTVLLQKAEDIGLAANEAADLLKKLAGTGSFSAKPPTDPRERKELFEGILDVVVSNMVVHAKEKALLERLRGMFDLEADDVAKLLRQAKARAHAQRKARRERLG